MRAGIQNALIAHYSPGFRVSPNMVLLARNDSFVELRDSVRREGIGEGNITLTQVS
jgi:hypothetical protein